MAAHTLPRTLGELRSSTEFSAAQLNTRSVKDEMRTNLIALLQAKETLFPGIIGFEDTVVPQIVNAVLSRQNFILLGLRGQAKSRILRALTETIRAVACCADLAIDLRATARIGGAIGLFDLQRAGADELGPDGDTD